MSLILHSHPLASYCWKVLIALYEKELAFEQRVVMLGDPEARAAFAALWPTARIPLLQDGERVVPETSLMIEYLDRRHPGARQLLPGDPDARFGVRLWDRLFDNYVMDPMQRFVAQLLRPEAQRDPLASERAIEDLRHGYALVEARMPGDDWAVTDAFSLADCAAAPALFYAAVVLPFPGGHPRLHAYFERLMERPSVQRVIHEARPWFKYFPLEHALPARFR